MATIQITLTLYGSIAKFADGKYIAQKSAELKKKQPLKI